MVKTLMSTMTIATVAADDVTSLLQLSAGVRILATVADEGKDTICVEAAVGDVAPVIGSFTARVSQQTAMVAAGSVAGEAGSFCVAKQDVLLMQRTFGLNTARDFDAALGSKKAAAAATTTTTTTVDFDNFDFAGDLNKKVIVKQCPDKSSTLTQTMEATVSTKGNKASTNLNADQVQVCACRNFLKDSVEAVASCRSKGTNGCLREKAALVRAASSVIKKEALVAAWAARVQKEEEKIVVVNREYGEEIVADFGMVCKQAEQSKDWTSIAKLINHPTEVVPYFKAANVQGWEHCAKSWIIEGACAETSYWTWSVVNPSLLQNNALTEDNIDAAIHRATSDLPKATDATAAEVDDMAKAFSRDLMKSSIALMQVSDMQKEALLRRAFQSAEVSNFVEGYINLPEETKHKVVNSALGSEDLVELFETMPTAERTALLVQLDGNHMDKAVAQKTETKVTNDAAGNRKTETVTKDRNGQVVHSHTHVHNARTGQTETSTQSKQHRHEHKHNSKSGQTGTQTVSNGHSHSHFHEHVNGETATVSNTHVSGTAGHSHAHFTDGVRRQAHR